MSQPKRHELKYVINSIDYIALKRKFEKVLKRDVNCIDNSYTITSVYFDNCYNQAYYQKIDGDPKRYKYRIRYYNDDFSHIKLEKKSKDNQMTMKSSVPLLKEEVNMIYEGRYDFLLTKDKLLYHEFYNGLKHGLLKPKVIVNYEREAFIHSIGNLRVTFDRNVKTAKNVDIFNSEINFISVLEPNQVILEVKFNGIIPSFITNIIQSGHVMQSSSSKYVVARKYNYQF